MHVISAKAVAFGEALKPEFKLYSEQIIKNAKCISEEMIKKGYKVISGGTDTHLLLIDLTNKSISGKAAEISLEKAGITINKSMVPFDKKSPFVTSGIRLGTPAVTTRGMKEKETLIISKLIDAIIHNPEDEKTIKEVNVQVKELCNTFPIYSNLYSK